jgi:hypothetical protein
MQYNFICIMFLNILWPTFILQKFTLLFSGEDVTNTVAPNGPIVPAPNYIRYWWNDDSHGEAKCLEKILPQLYLSTTDPI